MKIEYVDKVTFITFNNLLPNNLKNATTSKTGRTSAV